MIITEREGDARRAFIIPAEPTKTVTTDRATLVSNVEKFVTSTEAALCNGNAEANAAAANIRRDQVKALLETASELMDAAPKDTHWGFFNARREAVDKVLSFLDTDLKPNN